jgi:rhamnogalacturonyl hydrolase YesR
MKPTFQTKVEHASGLLRPRACETHALQSFWNITGDYYKSEARQDFWGEASLWAVLALTAFLPLISNAHTVMEFVRAISTY